MSTQPNSPGNGIFDVLIVGAGISGINTAYHIQKKLPGSSYVILDTRSNIGGTWDLFKYPGIRSDTDLHTFGFSWSAWKENRAIADGESIARYLKDNAVQERIDEHILFQHRVIAARWTSSKQIWIVTTETSNGQQAEYLARFIVLGTGTENFEGTTVHPQFWPEDMEYAGKRVVIVGSGATAITLLPNLAKQASMVTMLQRTPGYILPIDNATGNRWYHRIMPTSWSFQLDRWMFMWLAIVIFYFCRAFPSRARKMLESGVATLLPASISMDPHFKPSYKPWDQRLCFSPNGDFFEALRNGRADVATGKIRTIKGRKIVLESGQELEADILVTATGLKLVVGGGIQLTVDGRPVQLADRYTWRTSMLEDIPNLIFVTGYVNASWTLGAEVTAQLLCRLLLFMQSKGLVSATPRVSSARKLQPRLLWNLEATYVKRAAEDMPKCGDSGPWKGRTNYLLDLWRARYGSLVKNMDFAPEM